MSTGPELVEALNRVRERAGGSGSRAYLSAFGNWLRDEGVDPSSLPIRPLSQFLSLLNGYCRVSGKFVFFENGAVPQEGLNQAAADSPSETLAMRSELWRAMVNDRTELRYLLDLATLSIVEVVGDDVESPVASEPERYLAIPKVSSEEQREFAVDLLRKHLPPERAEALVPPRPDWMRTVISEAPEELHTLMRNARREWLVRRAQQWMHAHGIPEERFIYSYRSHERPASAPTQSHAERGSGSRSKRLRDALHRAIDQMTDQELEALRVPARLLID
ncbi:MAG TPA: hypothetical protein VE093_31915 [Polyangiaceae bacterium]|jgi:hypothetical protein|nr:hypothetical protein [Polyangiaceae bacterium]